jgi:hypothetical protein
MTAQLVAAVPCADGCQLRVLRERGVVAITDGQATKQGGHALSAARTRVLVGLLDRAMAADAPRELIGSVTMTNGRELHVRRWSTAVSVTDEPTIHTGWTLTMIDQVRGLRDALSRAAGGATPRVQSAPVDDRETAELMNARPHERTTTPTHTRSNAPTGKRRHAV